MPTAIVTHASAGLGPALSLALAERGWRLVLAHREPRTLEAQAAGLATATEVAALPGDVVDAGHREALLAAAGPELDLLVNNAAPRGRDVQPTSDGYPLDALEDAYREGVLAPLALIQLALPRLAADGCIVNVIPGSAGSPVSADERQSAAAALGQLTEAIAAAYPQLRVHGLDPTDSLTSHRGLRDIVGDLVAA